MRCRTSLGIAERPTVRITDGNASRVYRGIPTIAAALNCNGRAEISPPHAAQTTQPDRAKGKTEQSHPLRDTVRATSGVESQ
jgi:hypothetical protein